MSPNKPALPWVFAAPAIAIAAALARWVMQGSGNLYTSIDQRFYLPDPDLGWRLAPETYYWIGLEQIAIAVGFAAALAVAAWLVCRRERSRARPMGAARLALVGVSLLPLILPAVAFASGFPPHRARERIETDRDGAGEGIQASLPGAPAGRYRVLEHEGTLVAATIRAGGDTFEGRFAAGIDGRWTGNPRDLASPSSARVAVKAASIETGIATRDRHAGEYLRAKEFPAIELRLEEILASRADGPRRVSFTARGAVTLMGKSIATDVIGTVTELDAAGKARLGLGSGAALVVNASLTIPLADTPIDTSGGSFDTGEIPTRVSLVLIHEEES